MRLKSKIIQLSPKETFTAHLETTTDCLFFLKVKLLDERVFGRILQRRERWSEMQKKWKKQKTMVRSVFRGERSSHQTDSSCNLLREGEQFYWPSDGDKQTKQSGIGLLCTESDSRRI